MSCHVARTRAVLLRPMLARHLVRRERTHVFHTRAGAAPVRHQWLNSSTRFVAWSSALCAILGVYEIAASSPLLIPRAHAEGLPESENAVKSIRLREVQKHGRDAERRWVIHNNRVYDIEDWIPNHPGMCFAALSLSTTK